MESSVWISRFRNLKFGPCDILNHSWLECWNLVSFHSHPTIGRGSNLIDGTGAQLLLGATPPLVPVLEGNGWTSTTHFNSQCSRSQQSGDINICWFLFGSPALQMAMGPCSHFQVWADQSYPLWNWLKQFSNLEFWNTRVCGVISYICCCMHKFGFQLTI